MVGASPRERSGVEDTNSVEPTVVKRCSGRDVERAPEVVRVGDDEHQVTPAQGGAGVTGDFQRKAGEKVS